MCMHFSDTEESVSFFNLTHGFRMINSINFLPLIDLGIRGDQRKLPSTQVSAGGAVGPFLSCVVAGESTPSLLYLSVVRKPSLSMF